MTYRRCRCPMWMFGSIGGKRIRKALDTVSWGTAEEILRALDPDESPVKITLKVAGERFLADCELRLAKESARKYKLLITGLNADIGGAVEVKVITADDLARHRENWKLTLSPLSARKRLERLKTFFRFCQERGWVKTNPAILLKAPHSKPKTAVPFSDAEMEKILWAAEQYPELYPMSREHGRKVKAFVLVLQYSGLWIS